MNNLRPIQVDYSRSNLLEKLKKYLEGCQEDEQKDVDRSTELFDMPTYMPAFFLHRDKKDRFTLLEHAIDSGKLETVKVLLQCYEKYSKHCEPNAYETAFRKSFIMACEQGKTNVVKIFLPYNVIAFKELFSRPNMQGDKICMVAIRNGQFDIADLLLKKAKKSGMANSTVYQDCNRENDRYALTNNEVIASMLKPCASGEMAKNHLIMPMQDLKQQQPNDPSTIEEQPNDPRPKL